MPGADARTYPDWDKTMADLKAGRLDAASIDPLVVVYAQQNDPDLAALEVRHREHAVVEDRVRALKSTGVANLPFSAFAANQAWLELALAAHDLTVWTQHLLFTGEHAVCESKRLRYRLLHVAARLTRHARRLTLHLPADWPWAGAIEQAFKRLNALPT